MKKTLITLLAFSGFAMADADLLWTIDLTKPTSDSSRITVSDGASYTPHYWSKASITSAGTTNTNDQKIALNDNNGSLGIRLNDEFSLVFTADIVDPLSTKTGDYSDIPVFLQVGEGGNWNLKVGIDSDNRLIFATTGYVLTQGDTSNNGKLTGGQHTFSLTLTDAETITSGRKDGNVEFYVDGTLAASGTLSGNNRVGTNPLSTLILGNIYQEHAGIAGTYSSISAYSGKFIPEPATATLSLLALAGLASRRRRH